MHCRNDVAAVQPGLKTIVRTGLPSRTPILWILTAAILFGTSAVEAAALLAADAKPISGKQKPEKPALPARVPWTNSHVIGGPEPPHPYQLERAFPHHKFHNSVYLIPEPGTDRLFVMEYSPAIVRAIKDDPNSKEEVELLQYPAGKGKKSEALSVIFHPNYQKNRLVYIFANVKNGDGPR